MKEKEEIKQKEIETLNRVWQGLYDCQDDDSLKRGMKYYDFFLVHRNGISYKVSVELDEYDTNINKEEEE